MPAIIAAQVSVPLDVKLSVRHLHPPMIDGTDTAKQVSQWTVITGVLNFDGTIYIPAIDSLHGKVISLFYHNTESGHSGALTTTELVSSNFYWPVMCLHVRQCVSCCEVCHQMKAHCHGWHEINKPLETPSLPWEGVSMDVTTDWPESTASGDTLILLIKDRLTKMEIYLMCCKDIRSSRSAQAFFEPAIWKRCVPANLVPHRGTQFTSRFWTRGCSHISTDHWL